MKKRLFASAAVAVAIFLCAAVPLLAGDGMKPLPGDHFIVFFQEDEMAARDVLHQAERMYTRILRNLGHDRLENPWLGDRRCKIKIYRSREAFQSGAAKGVAWAEGLANPGLREIYVFNGAPNLMNSVLPHEITHMLFDDIVGHAENIPLWLNEGVALSQETGREEAFYPVARDHFATGTHMPFEEMTKLRMATGLDEAKAGVFYAQSTVTVNFLLRTFHEKKFLKFCSLLRDGSTVEEALKRVYATDRVGTLKDLEEKVKRSLE